MPSLVINSQGLGTLMLADCSTGQMIDCDSWSNLFNWTCWGACPNALAITTPVAPGAPASLTAIPDTTGAAAQALSNAAMTQTLANNAAANVAVGSSEDTCSTLSANWPWPLDGISCSSMLIAGIGVAFLLLVIPKVVGR